MKAILTRKQSVSGTIQKKAMQAIYAGVAGNRHIVQFRVFTDKPKSEFVYADLRIDDPASEVFLYANIRCRAVGIEGHSAALAQALDAVGIEMDTSINGVGHNAVVNAISAIMRALGHTEYTVIEI
ncbi:hypothetical protein [Acidithiobacillus thiooxidans]|uniref:Uncharacterized protein n=2 Tax=Acidithiobacillus thiooxidans TaxID=930 RepID=A0A1C2IAV5_ACITH|nr:hypothetical protein [Acidithiobacillus thiooxidans]MDX5935391.1 hypothetical protein [Acidithiobacillus thiooxidans]OCX67517.1 hypothetical protein A6P07_20015 [Acidithiobacillus thiooxidans]OCX73115.1 hypothetical protein A6O24_12430 [Acidithiobacillus thiooxidans]OCX81264.1 hypothetical protein A6M27_19735 [Acidithiobacillus thiooxidans]OCX81513.1 hypothetical protein A6O26_13035 [Acidithiobacillus thiooxidans]